MKLQPTRRRVLQLGAATAGVIAAPAIIHAEPAGSRTLHFHSLNSGEKLTTTYWIDGKYVAEELTRVNRLMRDLRTNDIHPIDVRLLDLLYDINLLTASSNPLYIMSGYRSPETNARLAAKDEDVDEGSFHMRGMALDLTQDMTDPGALWQAARKVGRGGAGFYPTRHPFVHVDVGPLDEWKWPAKGRAGRSEEYDRLIESGAVKAPAPEFI